MKEVGYAFLVTLSDESGKNADAFCVILEVFRMDEAGKYAEELSKETNRFGNVNSIKYLGPALISKKLLPEQK